MQKESFKKRTRRRVQRKVGRLLVAGSLLFPALGGAVYADAAPPAAAASISVTDMTGHTKEELVQAMLGDGLSVSNVEFKGLDTSAGTFTGGENTIGFDRGIVLSTGSIHLVPGPNDDSGAGEGNELAGDADLDALNPDYSTNDATVLEFDFVPNSDIISFQYVFGSEEYNEFVGSAYNDVFAFFVNGNNAAIVPGTTDTPVSINNVNSGSHAEYYINNTPDEGTAPLDTQLDGLTKVLNVEAKVNKGVSNHMKLAIADAGDFILDSDIFLRAGSFRDQPVDPGKLQFQLSQSTVAEGNGSAAITVSRTDGVQGTVSVNYTTANGSATAGADYTASSGTLTFEDGQAAKTFAVPIIDDSNVEGSETVLLTLSNPTGGAVLGAGKNATLTILDNDQTPEPQQQKFRFDRAAYSEGEGSGSVVVTVVREGGSSGEAAVKICTCNVTAFAGSDYTASSGTLTFKNGETTKTFSIPIIDDIMVEGAETFLVKLYHPTAGAELGTPSSATVTIVDNDSHPV